jgi:alkanesulfonate monooxygenase SsuD/methylene tetrahydromethanopterin reductase-like flavin-dependent oxidoreductase (luciferase family)
MQFGVGVLQFPPWDEMVRRSQDVEALGFDSVWLADMYVVPDAPTTPWFEGWTSIAALATQTRRIRIGIFTGRCRNPSC